ncbi:hypothetical protein [Bdellovibrio bacteriovorus]|uniref:hypothetical protein n=1 Tax=Bdellovibrio bacteriovorus TaxID=959 RepID=UPI0035A8C824
MKNVFILLMLPVFYSSLSYAKRLEKPFDGTSRSCIEGQVKPHDKMVHMSLTSAETLNIRIVKCERQTDSTYQQKQDTSPGKETYVTPEGVSVEETFSQFELVVTTEENSILEVIDLKQLSTTGLQEVNLPNSKGQQSLLLFLRAQHNIKAANGINEIFQQAWSPYRLHSDSSCVMSKEQERDLILNEGPLALLGETVDQCFDLLVDKQINEQDAKGLNAKEHRRLTIENMILSKIDK